MARASLSSALRQEAQPLRHGEAKDGVRPPALRTGCTGAPIRIAVLVIGAFHRGAQSLQFGCQRLGPRLRLALPRLRLALPCLRLALPCLRLALPCLRLALPRLRLALPRLRL